ncbi:ROK family transcriptional regulator [Nonomuraea dietziae]|uniref:Putative NBD/HSP70 family sugar kinase n=1 Tax=Nonomuraea dietziae TaxID=65515 RepID=A0A7W5VFK4_9ACTN|nr:ROK family transcriptional regulator [Nonomuraea dietziae]MBB3733991.1 putative NBD/HSP70 family sugar kinase [Nonomuraea dietziae]
MVTNGADLGRLRRINELAVIAAVRESGDLRVAQIAERIGLARTSVGEVVRGLVGHGWLEEKVPVAAGRGRPAHRYRFRASAGHVLGLDIGAHNVRAMLADLDGTVLATVHRVSDPAMPRQERLQTIDRAVSDCLRQAKATTEQVWMSVAATTGWVDREGQILMSGSILDWAGVDLAGHLRALLGAPALVENDSRLAALAEHRRGVGQGVRDLVLLQAGRRTGLGILIDGRLHCGFGYVAGDLSMHRALKWEPAIEYLLFCDASPATGPTGDAVADVLVAAAEGHAGALVAVRRYVREMAIAAAAIASIIDPEVIVLGGSMSKHAGLLLPLLSSELDLLCLRTPELRSSSLGADSAALGAVCLALQHLDAAILNEHGGPLGPLRRPEAFSAASDA